MNATKTVPVACTVCRKAVATKMVKDNGHRTYPACNACVRCLHLPTVLYSLPAKS